MSDKGLPKPSGRQTSPEIFQEQLPDRQDLFELDPVGKAVIAIEAMEGTDKCIRRAGHLANGPFTIVKVSKPKQDLRFDVPVIGLNTIENFQEAGGGVLAIEAGKTLVLDKEKIVDWANGEKISIVGV